MRHAVGDGEAPDTLTDPPPSDDRPVAAHVEPRHAQMFAVPEVGIRDRGRLEGGQEFVVVHLTCPQILSKFRISSQSVTA
jgi:hypothetical protein